MIKSILVFLALLGLGVSAATYSYDWRPQDAYRPAKTLEQYYAERFPTWVDQSPAMLCIYNRNAQSLLDLLAKNPKALSATVPILDTRESKPVPDPRYVGQWACNGWADLAQFGGCKLFKQCDAIDPGGWKTSDSFGATPFMHASGRPYQLDMVKYMVEKGADINATNRAGSTALDYALRGEKGFQKCCKEDDTDPSGIVKYLRGKGAKTGAELKTGSATAPVNRPRAKK
jgi:hypothetical protein